MPNHTIIVAAGEGKRFGSPKQFYAFRGRPLFLYAVEAFERNKAVRYITIVVPKNHQRKIKGLLEKSDFKKISHVVAGGDRRQDSVLNGLKTIENQKNGIVIIHDGVRPVVSQNIINKGLKLCRRFKSVVFGIPIHDTVKEVKDNIVLKTVSRKNLYLIQTPQFFEVELLKDAYKKADPELEYTDEASILESLGLPVHLFLGDRNNIKITEKSDLNALGRIIV
jgi:2-C-methyl-D-erythritol 4-phosphate cytidylyltransferase